MRYTAVLATFIAGALAQSTRTVTAYGPFSATYSGSIGAVSAQTTSFIAVCDGSNGCPSGESHTVTLGGTTNLIFDTDADYNGQSVTGIATCDIKPTTSWSCNFFATSVNADNGETSTITITTTTSVSRLPIATLVVTAGAEKLPKPSPGAAPRATVMGTSMGKGVIVTAIGLASAFVGLAIFL